MPNERTMRTKSEIVFHAYRGTVDPPEIVTISVEGAIVPDAAAMEYWRTALAKFYGGTQIMLEEESSNRRSRY